MARVSFEFSQSQTRQFPASVYSHFSRNNPEYKVLVVLFITLIQLSSAVEEENFNRCY